MRPVAGDSSSTRFDQTNEQMDLAIALRKALVFATGT